MRGCLPSLHHSQKLPLGLDATPSIGGWEGGEEETLTPTLAMASLQRGLYTVLHRVACLGFHFSLWESVLLTKGK